MESNLDYEVSVWRQGGKTYGRIPELAIVEVADDINILWARIEERRQELIERFKEAGIEDEIPMPASREREALDRSTYRFLIKTLAVTSAVIVSLYVLGAQLQAAGSHFAKAIKTEINVRHPLEQWAEKLESMPEEKREKLHKTLHTLVTNLRPFLQELKPILEDAKAPECTAIVREPQGNEGRQSGSKGS